MLKFKQPRTRWRLLAASAFILVLLGSPSLTDATAKPVDRREGSAIGDSNRPQGQQYGPSASRDKGTQQFIFRDLLPGEGSTPHISPTSDWKGQVNTNICNFKHVCQ